MSQRNPMNDRYQTDEHLGKTRKSAAAMKPKTKAAQSVRMQPKVKTKEQKKAEQKVVRDKQTQVNRQYYNPPTAEYKRLRKLWWVLLVAAIVLTALSWLGRGVLPEAGTYIALGLAYVCIIGALYVDFSKIRKVRRAYQEEMMSKKTKEMRAAEKQVKAAQRDAKHQEGATSQSAKEPAAELTPPKQSLLSSVFPFLKNKEVPTSSTGSTTTAHSTDVASKAKKHGKEPSSKSPASSVKNPQGASQKSGK